MRVRPVRLVLGHQVDSHFAFAAAVENLWSWGEEALMLSGGRCTGTSAVTEVDYFTAVHDARLLLRGSQCFPAKLLQPGCDPQLPPVMMMMIIIIMVDSDHFQDHWCCFKHAVITKNKKSEIFCDPDSQTPQLSYLLLNKSTGCEKVNESK